MARTHCSISWQGRVIAIDTTPAPFVDIDGLTKPGGSVPLEDYATDELRRRDVTLASLRVIAKLDHPYAKFARLAGLAASQGQWPKAKTLWANRVCAL